MLFLIQLEKMFMLSIYEAWLKTSFSNFLNQIFEIFFLLIKKVEKCASKISNSKFIFKEGSPGKYLKINYKIL